MCDIVYVWMLDIIIFGKHLCKNFPFDLHFYFAFNVFYLPQAKIKFLELFVMEIEWKSFQGVHFVYTLLT